jgi:hypothetical protein
LIPQALPFTEQLLELVSFKGQALTVDIKIGDKLMA